MLLSLSGDLLCNIGSLFITFFNDEKYVFIFLSVSSVSSGLIDFGERGISLVTFSICFDTSLLGERAVLV